MTCAMLDEMELRHLRYFVAVAEALSFTKAAEKLRLAQPSLTRQVRNLEDEIGVRLLDRANNRVALTEEGRAFLFDSKKLLAMSVESVASVQRHIPCSLLPWSRFTPIPLRDMARRSSFSPGWVRAYFAQRCMVPTIGLAR